MGAFLFILLALQNPEYVQPGGVSGQLRTIDDVPAVNVRVAAFAVPAGTNIPDDGPNYFVLSDAAGIAMTDNEGRYLFQDLAPGRYYLMAGVSGQGTCYPASSHINGAEIITVDSGFIVEGRDFQMLHRFGGKLSGMVKANMQSLKRRRDKKPSRRNDGTMSQSVLYVRPREFRPQRG